MKKLPFLSFPNWGIVFCDIVAIALWSFAITKSFAFDIDTIIVNAINPSYVWITQWKIVALTIFLSAVCIIGGIRKFIFMIAYILFYPAILLLYKIPFLLIDIGNWNIGIAVFNSILTLLTELRYRVYLSTIYITSVLLILITQSRMTIYPGIALIVLAISISYIKTFISTLRAPRVLELYRRCFSKANEHIEQHYRPEVHTRGLPIRQREPNESKALAAKLEVPVLYNRACLFFARRLQDYQKSEAGLISGLLSAIRLIITTIFVFFIIHIGLYKINPHTFNITVTYFDLFYASYSNMLFGNGVNDVATGTLARIISMYQGFLSFLIIIIFISFFISVKKKRHQEELDKTIENAEEASRNVELVIQEDYSYKTIDEAIDDLKNIESGMVKFIVRMSNSLK